MFASNYSLGVPVRPKSNLPPRPPLLKATHAYNHSSSDEEDLITPPDVPSFEAKIASRHSTPHAGYFVDDDGATHIAGSAVPRSEGREGSPKMPVLKRRMSKGLASPRAISDAPPSPVLPTTSTSPFYDHVGSSAQPVSPRTLGGFPSSSLSESSSPSPRRSRSSYFPGSPSSPSSPRRGSGIAYRISAATSSGEDAQTPLWELETPREELAPSQVGSSRLQGLKPVRDEDEAVFTNSLTGMSRFKFVLVSDLAS